MAWDQVFLWPTVTDQKNSGYRNKKQNVKTARGRSNSSVSWLRRNINDPYIKLARQEGYVSRAAFKILQIEEKFKILRKSSHIIDLGSSPGSWLQVLVKFRKTSGSILGLDLTPLSVNLPDMEFIQGDFLDDEIQDQIVHRLGSYPDLILSDMAAAAMGDKGLDHIRSAALVASVLEFAEKNLQKKGNLIMKLIRGGEEAELLKKCRSLFSRVKLFKPDSSYSDSAEIYIISLNRL